MGKHLNLMVPMQSQRGVVLFIALIALVAITLASIALIRSVDTANVIAGNFAFKESTIHATDVGTETAAVAMPTLVASDGSIASANKYYPVRQSVNSSGIPASVDWTAVQKTPIPGTGNSVQYVIERMCEPVVNLSTGALINANGPNQSNNTNVSNFCVTTERCTPPSSRNASPICEVGDIYYRVTTRVSGPRGTISVVQSVVTM
jgi:type IV pilus assembly protein PilX